ncbi:hypothetical protein EV644_10391 [Kribbella orskensis]|uniref:Uncharacterized protein n=1 Tax=Kribbella orskensis TaxID=2512216 RepID=A0ABY2BP88_9ACTN|nr:MULTISPECIES: hypothetical protein [Kribbella]TCN39823.1 hypothetical protein EV642_106329 [Kribbella sp. VKM Ac-2500]TCO27394.1 hypothetical protein EV644_10391 [Kribbella orskensis]
MTARVVWGRVMDALYAASDASHRARGWEVRKGAFGSRRYRLDVAAWLESQRRLERFGSMPGPSAVVRDEAVDVWDSMRWKQADMTPVLREAIEQGRESNGYRREAA